MNNTFGTLLQVTTFGESHGVGLGVVLDGLPAGIAIDQDFIQSELDRRRPGQSSVSTPRKEKDSIQILSGVFEGKSTGTALAMVLFNADQHSSDYTKLASVYRPGHADYTFQQKYGLRDYRGGGRSSGRETVSRVAAGAVAKLLLKEYGITVRACAEEIASIRAEKRDWNIVEQNIVRCGDAGAAQKMVDAIHQASAESDSVGGVIYGEILNVPAGLGEPVFDKMDALLAQAMFSIGGVKGFEIGEGFHSASLKGSENNDSMRSEGFASNHAGGILGGISNGNTITFRLGIKPTPSIGKLQKTVDISGNECELNIGGRHDPCLVPRIIPVCESMAALVTADLLLRSRANRL